MQVTTEEKKKLFKKHGGSESNTGKAEVQIALFSERVKHLTDHLKTNKGDNHNRKALIKLVSKRRHLLDYLRKKDITRYREIIKELNIRK